MYYPTVMSRPVLDGFTFARARGKLDGRLDASAAAAAFLRLVGLGATPGELAYSVEGISGELSKPALRVIATGAVTMTCQRCLMPVDVAVAVDSQLELAATQTAIDAADDEQDRVLASAAMDVLELVEDEVILALPMVARHSSCSAGGGSAAGEAGETAGEAGRNVFAALAKRSKAN